MERRSRTVSITIPEPLLEEVDRICSEKGYTRSEFVREAIRLKIMLEKKGRGGGGWGR
ncbi:MAG: ribbon-helix-helix domain-containing protein [Thermofilaceae archaeon]